MEANKIKGEAKSLVLDNGAEITYCELGTQNEEVLVSGAFFFHTFMPVMEILAQRYHVFGIVMRFDGPADIFDTDGGVHWTRQWGKNVYDFVVKMGIKKFHYFGKCHGTVPGWYLFKNHPEMLIDFCSFFLCPHLKGQDSDSWFEMARQGDIPKMMRRQFANPRQDCPKRWLRRQVSAMRQQVLQSPNMPPIPKRFGIRSTSANATSAMQPCLSAICLARTTR